MPIFLLRRQRPWSHSMGNISKTKMWHFLKLRWIEAFICRICFYNGQRRINKQLYAYRPSIVDIHKNAHIKGGGILHFNIPWNFQFFKINKSSRSGVFRVKKNALLSITGNFKIYPGCTFFVQKNAQCRIGSGYVNIDSRIMCFQEITIGENVAISENVIIRDSDNHQIINYPHRVSAPIHIGNHVWIGMGAIILKGVTIGDGAIIGAGSVVTRDIPAKSMAVGSPARVIRTNVEWKL